MCVKTYSILSDESITIPCLNCIVFYTSSYAKKFSIATTVGYQSDSKRSRISYINGDSSNGLEISHSAEDTQDAYAGKFIIKNNANDAEIVVIGIKGFSNI